jgi:DNA-directed RNA polymerase specialized sigma24 family protein
MMELTDSDGYLVRAAVAGSREAAERLYRRYEREFSIALGSWRLRTDYEDLKQEAVMHLFRQLHRWDAERPFGAWAARVLQNFACGASRSPRWRRRHYAYLDPDRVAAPEPPEEPDLSEMVHEAFASPAILREIRALLVRAGRRTAQRLLEQPRKLGQKERKTLSRLRENMARLLHIHAKGRKRSDLVRRHLGVALLAGRLDREMFE